MSSNRKPHVNGCNGDECTLAVPKDDEVAVKVLAGMAERFSCELVPGDEEILLTVPKRTYSEPDVVGHTFRDIREARQREDTATA